MLNIGSKMLNGNSADGLLAPAKVGASEMTGGEFFHFYFQFLFGIAFRIVSTLSFDIKIPAFIPMYVEDRRTRRNHAYRLSSKQKETSSTFWYVGRIVNS